MLHHVILSSEIFIHWKMEKRATFVKNELKIFPIAISVCVKTLQYVMTFLGTNNWMI